ncbi:MAG TPA: hypothetical protein VN476_17185 [Pyrinomonadaceae bacterium]|nr:hypothetical protein [Pyrinomonadaceae bacterium]
MKPKARTKKTPRMIEPQEKSLWWKIRETLALHSWIEVISKSVRIWGATGTAAFLLGGVTVAGLAFFGWLPKFVISEEYRNKPIKIGSKPNQVRIIDDKPLPDWLQPYTFWLEQEAQARVDQKLVKGFILCPLISQEMGSSPEFKWMIKASPNFEVSGWGFSLSKDTYLSKLMVTDENPSLTFTVPSLTDGDRLVAILVVLGKESAPVGDCKDFVHSIVN